MSEKHLNLAKQTLPELQELLQRQNTLLKNRKLLEQLKDKGDSVKQLRDKIQREIQHRKDLENVEGALSSLTLNSDHTDVEFLKEKHVEYVCSKEKPIHDTRYRPHRTLVDKPPKTSPQKSPKKFTEVTAAYEPPLKHELMKCIPLSESLVIQNEQAIKIMEEKAKKTLLSLNDALADGNDTDETDDEDGTVELQDDIVDADAVK